MFWKFDIKVALWTLFFAVLFSACTDDDSDIEYLFEREVTDLSVLRECAKGTDSTALCYQVRFRYPMAKNHFEGIYLWIGDAVIDDTSKAVSSNQIKKADEYYPYSKTNTATFDTLDLTSMLDDYINVVDSVHVALFCKYSDDEESGAVQHIFLHFGDDLPPSRVTLYDSVWTTGALFEWYRPTDQTDYYKPMELSGPIVGYNLVIYSADTDEDLRDLKVKITTNNITDSTGDKLYKRHARVRSKADSVWVDSVAHGDNVKNYLRLAVIDGKGFDFSEDSTNLYRMIIDGLKAESRYTIGISAWDSAGNSSGTEGTSTVETNQLFITTDSIAPLMPQKIFFLEDTLYPGFARLDSNNRVRIFFSQSVDPIETNHGIESDTTLLIPQTCPYKICYDTVASYLIEYFDKSKKEWTSYSDVGGAGRYGKLYEIENDTMVVSATGTFVTDTIRRVSPGDTLILRIRSIDKSGYYSHALIDTLFVSLGALSKEVECPTGYLAVKADSSLFCMERLEHQDSSGAFIHNVMYSEAQNICESESGSGFSFGLCNERDWELVCLSGGHLSYGVIEENNLAATEYLYTYCNVSTNDSLSANVLNSRDARCLNPFGIRDMPGQYQEWVKGRSEDTIAVIKGASYKIFDGIDRETIALCTNRFFPYYTRLAYTTDSVYLYREGTAVDTVFEADTLRTLYKILTEKDFKDTLQFFDVKDSSGNVLGIDYALYSEYKKGGSAWLKELAGSLIYEPSEIKAVFLTGERVSYREVSAFYKSPTIGFRCCAYPE